MTGDCNVIVYAVVCDKLTERQFRYLPKDVHLMTELSATVIG